MSLGPWWAVALKVLLIAAFLTVAVGSDVATNILSLELDPFVRRAGAKAEGDQMASTNEIVESVEATSEGADDVNVRRAAGNAEDDQATEIAGNSEAASKGAEDENVLIRRRPGLVEQHAFGDAPVKGAVLQAAYVEADGTLVDAAQHVRRGENAAFYIDSMGEVHGQDDVSPEASLTKSPVSRTELPNTLATLHPSVPRQVRVSQTLVQELVDPVLVLVRGPAPSRMHGQDDVSPEALLTASTVSGKELPYQPFVQEVADSPPPAPLPQASTLQVPVLSSPLPVVEPLPPVQVQALPAACVASACGAGYALKPNFASLQCAAVSCTISDQATCCDLATLQPAEEESSFLADFLYLLVILMVLVPCMVLIAWFFARKQDWLMKSRRLPFMASFDDASDSGTPSNRTTPPRQFLAAQARNPRRAHTHTNLNFGTDAITRTQIPPPSLPINRTASLPLSGTTPDGGSTPTKSSYQMRRASQRNIDTRDDMARLGAQVDNPDAGGGAASADARGGTDAATSV